ncbi:MAG: ABC transporter substrate-binding protein [Clostridia bacterium]|nr:ABC transporter substrate-binding protein [Clostridia bacterium]
MKNQTKKILSLLAAAILLLASAALVSCQKSLPVIGINQYAQHPSLDNCRTGFLAGLAEAGLTEGKDFTVDVQNAGADDNLNAQIASTFASKSAALMVGIATPSAMACFNAAEEKDIPVVFIAVTDPAAASLTEGNVTGTSDRLPVSAQLELIRKLQPDAKTIGILYTLSEPNSVSAIAEYKEKAPSYGFTIEAVGVAAQSEVPLAADSLIAKKVDCFSNLTDNGVVDVLDSILEKTNAAGIPVYGSEVEQVKKGCVASAGIDYYKLGIQTGKLAAKILRGEAKASDLPFESVTEYEIYLNEAACGELNVSVPADVAASAVKADA